MNEDTLNMEIRKFLKKVGISSQREIEHAVANAIDNGKLTGSESLAVIMTLELPALDIKHELDGSINLELYLTAVPAPVGRNGKNVPGE